MTKEAVQTFQGQLLTDWTSLWALLVGGEGRERVLGNVKIEGWEAKDLAIFQSAPTFLPDEIDDTAIRNWGIHVHAMLINTYPELKGEIPAPLEKLRRRRKR